MPATRQRDRQETVDALLDRFGTTYAEEAGFRVRNAPTPLFRLTCLSLLLSARIRAEVAVAANRALADAGWTTLEKLRESRWADRTRVLNRSGYARYDERTARMLGETADMLDDRYGGDLRRLRAEADEDPAKERRLLRQFKGIGDVGVDIFFREAQAIWPELHPFVDKRAADAAGHLGLPTSPDRLADLVPADDFPRLVAALVRVRLAKAYEEVTG